MSDTPDFRELVGEDLPRDEEERLRRVHELLVAAGPPPELPPHLQEPVEPEQERDNVSYLPRRRTRASASLIAIRVSHVENCACPLNCRRWVKALT